MPIEANLCVSRGLAAFLESRFGVNNAHVLYDRPASAFVPIERGERERHRQALFARFGVRKVYALRSLRGLLPSSAGR